MIYHFTNENFRQGALEHVTLDDSGIIGSDGSWMSEIIQTERFNRLLMSWNVTSQGFVELKIRVKNGKWSSWMTYGKWADYGRNEGSIRNQKDDVARVLIDEVIANTYCDAFQVKVEFTQGSTLLRNITVSLDLGTEIQNHDVMNMDIEVPRISQLMIPEIGNVICSPASLAMVMNYYGAEQDVIDTSQGCFDNGASIYGNWSYNIAYAGERNFHAFVMYCKEVELLMKYIQKGMPLVASINTKDKNELKGSPQAYPAGHLIVIRGFEIDEDVYILVNDPASKTIEGVFRKYLLKEFLDVWNQVIYVIKPMKH